MTGTKITIAIPTRTNPATLQPLIDCCFQAISASKYSAEIELLVSINTANPVEDSSLREMKKKSRVVTNQNGDSYDEHLDFIFRVANGEFVKLFGDDDVPSTGFIDELVSEVMANADLSCLVHDFRYYSEKDSDWRTQETHDRVGLGSQKLAVRHGQWGQVSCTMFRRLDWLDIPSVRETDYIHAYKFMYLFARDNSGTVRFLPSKLVLVRPGTPNFSSSNKHRLQTSLRGLLVHRLIADDFKWSWKNLHLANKQMLYAARTLAFAKAVDQKYFSAQAYEGWRIFPFLPGTTFFLLIALTPPFLLRILRFIVRTGMSFRVSRT
jgi:hypothetical protein